jgi:glycosyltransferase involved in cell wall biosynthesis
LAILHGVWNFPVIAAAQICHAQGVPYIVFPHGTLNPRAIELRASCQKHALLNLGVRKNLGHAARIAFSTHSEAERVAAYLRQPLTPFVLPNIVEASDFASLPERGSFRVRHGISESTQVIIHYGRVARVKGIEFVVRAVARLRGQKRDVVLVVVGGDEGGYRTHLENIASELGVRGSLIFTGLLDRQEGRKVLVDADVFVLASHSENFGIAVIEAMLCRIPVVVSDNVGLAEELVRGDVGVMVSVDADGVLLAKAIALLLDDKPRRQSLGKRGRQFAIDNYDVSAVQGRIEQLVAVSVKPPR